MQKKIEHHINGKFLVLAYTMPLHYLLGGREGLPASKKLKCTRKIKVKIKSLHGALRIYILKGSMSGIFSCVIFWSPY